MDSSHHSLVHFDNEMLTFSLTIEEFKNVICYVQLDKCQDNMV